MDMSDEQYFANLAGGQPQNESEEEPQEIASEGEPLPEFHVELAKAGGAVQTHHRVAAKKSFSEEMNHEPEGTLTVDVYQTPSEIVIESAVAGVRPEDLDVMATNDSVTIKGSRHREKEVKDDDYLYQECYWGRFSRSVILPQEVDPDAAVVNFKNGILTVRLPKLDKQKAKKLKVKLD